MMGYILVNGFGEQEQSSEGSTTPVKMPPPPSIRSANIVTLLPPDSIRSIDDLRYETVDAAENSLDPNERVIGIEINGEAKAYPIPILSSHEIVNDVVSGEPVAITWCPLCYTALVFSQQVEG